MQCDILWYVFFIFFGIKYIYIYIYIKQTKNEKSCHMVNQIKPKEYIHQKKN